MSRSRSPLRTLTALALGALTLASATLRADHHGDDHASLWAAITGPARSADNVRRDVYRKPLETLEFFGLKKDMHIDMSREFSIFILDTFLMNKSRLLLKIIYPGLFIRKQ